MNILITGFEPFNKSLINPSEQIAYALDRESIPGASIATAILPVDLEQGPETLLQTVEVVEPNAILCLGQASRRTVLSIERVAVNLLDFGIPDNAGNMIHDLPVVQEGPTAYFTTLPARKIYNALKKDGIPTELSMSAGSFICNQVIYRLMHYLASQPKDIKAGFIHVPALPEQVAQMNVPSPSMSLDLMIRGIRIAIQVIIGGVG